MSISDTFKEFLSNLAVDNAETISLRYGEITAALNKKFRSTESKTDNSLRVGSYGRWTAIKGISDLDMLYIMPSSRWGDYKSGGQYKLLKDAADAISERYPKTTVNVDRLVVRVLYQNFHIEVQPVFEQKDGSFQYPDTYGDGSWKITKPRAEIAAMKEFDEQKNNNLRRLCKMARAWKNKHGVGMGGLLVDTLAHKFLQSTTDYDNKSYLYYDLMVRDFFEYLSNEPNQQHYAALGSGQRVKVKSKFQRKAKKAFDLCKKAIDAEGESNQNKKWKKIFGKPFPKDTSEDNKASAQKFGSARNTEEFFEDRFAFDVRYSMNLECRVTQSGFRPFLLTEALLKRLRLPSKRSLSFYVRDHTIPGDFHLYWKVLNRGEKAIKRDCVRGQIFPDRGQKCCKEKTSFFGDHLVECVAVVNGIVVATDMILVPIAID